jgi:hypothetical protein
MNVALAPGCNARSIRGLRKLGLFVTILSFPPESPEIPTYENVSRVPLLHLG